ncbi:MAG: hypothetical protein NVS2B14_10720 [Chamaesiphon sp.]
MFHQVLVSGVTTLVPVGIATPPANITINPGDEIEEPTETAQDGRQVIAFTYTKGAKAEIDLDFGMAAPDVEAIIHGRKFTTGTSVPGMIFAEFIPTTTTVPARTTGQVGFGVTAQTGATTTAQAYYIDATTKLATPITIVDVSSTLTTNQISIGAALAITVSSDLVGKKIQLWCPQTFTAATILGSTPIGLITVFAQGLNFDNTIRTLVARNCSRLPGSALSSDPKRQVKLRILPDPTDGTGLGYSIQDTALTLAQ